MCDLYTQYNNDGNLMASGPRTDERRTDLVIKDVFVVDRGVR